MAISVRRITFSDGAIATTLQDLIQPGSGEKFTILRAAYRARTAPTGSPNIVITRTTSANAVQETVLDTGSLSAIDADSVVLDEDGVAGKADLRNVVLTDQDKLRVQRVGGNAFSIEITVDVVEET